mgnify:CR=1 FL=1
MSQTKKFFFRYKRKCKFCEEKTDYIDFKNSNVLSEFITERGKILSRKFTGTCSKHQRKLERAIKVARIMALLPFVRK